VQVRTSTQVKNIREAKWNLPAANHSRRKHPLGGGRFRDAIDKKLDVELDKPDVSESRFKPARSSEVLPSATWRWC
jgi:hypothetical protein